MVSYAQQNTSAILIYMYPFFPELHSYLGCHITSEFEINMYKLLYLKWITKEDLLYSTGNSDQCYMENSLFLECSLSHLKYFLGLHSQHLFFCLNFSVPEFYPQLLTPWVLVGGLIIPIYFLDFSVPISYLKSRQIALFGQLAVSI